MRRILPLLLAALPSVLVTVVVLGVLAVFPAYLIHEYRAAVKAEADRKARQDAEETQYPSPHHLPLENRGHKPPRRTWPNLSRAALRTLSPLIPRGLRATPYGKN